ncbi:ArsR/SmtB family transcription factor [Lacticaseibacillus saniviri]|uniref:Transcriptional regulator n=1 Tax=Lacticaseibacillus saniviri JCM 17471 = DSM 24301 TaxID=1293598 RepID=A0A0R2MUG2_9LACO|nr:metalloregulator ArsR/SmtB family transcription factor [Lacticaseibacillus saniviri]KRO17127.1 transcriptional regulator [Lacticaseibacillus saniviri JCM 17471 = DSM 24301]MCG4282061.1 metalloregulator ArsR/SmtB family transcription factor [Lacticaseibacillus saniviri]
MGNESQYTEAQTAVLKEFKRDIGHLNALSNASRQQLILILGSVTAEHGIKVNDLAERIGLSQPATSHHLKILKDIGMVDSRQVGNIVYYYLTLDDTVDRLEKILTALKRQMKEEKD